MSAGYPVSITVPIAWGEQDAFGHLNNVAYLRYFENVRMHLLDRVGILRSHRDHQVGVILASTTCNFLRPVHWPQQLTVSTACDHIGRTSFRLTYSITNEAGEECATGISVLVMYDYVAAHKVEVPATIREALASTMLR